MATYKELLSLLDVTEPSGFRTRVYIATLISADAIRSETEDTTSKKSQERKRFSQRILQSILTESLTHRGDDSPLAYNPIFESIYRAVVTNNKLSTVDTITKASDSVIQSAVDAAVTHLATSYPDPEKAPVA